LYLPTTYSDTVIGNGSVNTYKLLIKANSPIQYLEDYQN
jgi:hypothetical protein